MSDPEAVGAVEPPVAEVEREEAVALMVVEVVGGLSVAALPGVGLMRTTQQSWSFSNTWTS